MCDGKKKQNLADYGKTVRDYKKDRETAMQKFQKDAEIFGALISEFKQKLFKDENDNHNNVHS